MLGPVNEGNLARRSRRLLLRLGTCPALQDAPEAAHHTDKRAAIGAGVAFGRSLLVAAGAAFHRILLAELGH
ncbi:MAG: hypothetical protein ACSLFK_01870 [Gemmatimonadaceae bacterium]